jgi:CheY-like chemotaxis protein
MPNTGSLAGCRILVVEDDFLVGQVILDLLEDEGAEVLGPIGAVDEAVTFVAEQTETFDHVVLDLNLHGVKSYPVADELARRNIPFVFMTGYGKDALDVAHRDCPHCIKPITRATLLAALSRR